jgi:predicted secreted protein
MTGIGSQFFIFLIIWWLVLFAVLPWGIRRQESDEVGHDPGAPANPMLLKKAMITTAIAVLIWGSYFVASHYLGFSILELTGVTQPQ